VLSALLGAIIMIAVVRCRRKKSSNNRNGEYPHGHMATLANLAENSGRKPNRVGTVDVGSRLKKIYEYFQTKKYFCKLLLNVKYNYYLNIKKIFKLFFYYLNFISSNHIHCACSWPLRGLYRC